MQQLVSLLIITPILALASLPDEINFRPYKKVYNKVSQDLSTERYKLESTTNELNSVNNELRNNESRISGHYDQIANDQDEISRISQQIPDLQYRYTDKETRIIQLEQQIRELESKVTKLTNQIRRNRQRIKPINQQLANKQTQLNRLKKELDTLKAKISKGKTSIAKLKKESDTLQATNQQLKVKISNLENSVKENKNKIAGIRKTNEELKRNITELTNKGSKLSRQINELQGKIKTARIELKKLLSSAVDLAAVTAKRKEIQTLVNKLKPKQTQLQKLQLQTKSKQNRLKSNKAEIAKLKNLIASVPQKVQAHKNKLQNNKKIIAQNKVKTNQLQRNVQADSSTRDVTKGKVQIVSQDLNQIKRSQSQLQQKIKELRNLRADKERRILIKEDKRQNNIRIAQNLQLRINELQQKLPQLQRNIQQARRSIESISQVVQSLELTRSSLITTIAEAKNQIAILEQRQSLAYNEYIQREDLYNNYLEEAKELGSSQTTSAQELGSNEGSKIAVALAQKNGQEIGAKYGKAKAQLIAYVRGENEGYPQGYDNGLVAQDSINAGQQAGSNDATAAAMLYAQKTLKPQFFETSYLEALKKQILGFTSNFSKSFNSSFMLQDFQLVQTIDDLSELEIRSSRSIKTAMDIKIESALQQEEQVIELDNNYAQAKFAYIKPSAVPYGKPACQSVYKAVSVFKEACRSSYQSSFSYKYYRSSKATFGDSYPDLYEQSFSLTQVKVKAAHFQVYKDESYKVSFASGKEQGKKDIYDQSYSETYSLTYPLALDKQSTIAKNQAQAEVDQWVANNPSVTIVSAQIDGPSLRANQMGQVKLTLKNVGSKESRTTGSLTVTSLSHITVAQKIIQLPTVPANSIAQVLIPFTISENASSKDTIKFAAALKLPGDKYQAVRLEKTIATGSIAPNPKFDLKLSFDSTPNIKRGRKYYIHSAYAKITPQIETIRDGYTATIEVKEDDSSYVKLKTSSAQTGKINLNETKKVKMSYVFSKYAKKRYITFIVKVSYQGQAIGQKEFTVKPR